MSSLPSLGPRGEGWVAIQGVLLVAEVAVGVLAGSLWSGDTRLAPTAAGVIAMALGAVLGARGIVDLREALTALPPPRDGASLVDTGAYALVRHPIYGGIIVGSAGFGLAAASPLAVAGAAVLLAFFRLKSAREEAWLAARYPGYDAYRGRTRRMIPWVY